MRIRWTSQARSDLVRLYEFLAPVNRQAAAHAVQSLPAAPALRLRDHINVARAKAAYDQPRKASPSQRQSYPTAGHASVLSELAGKACQPSGRWLRDRSFVRCMGL
jgi:plasmid stabilization system protein ParE